MTGEELQQASRRVLEQFGGVPLWTTVSLPKQLPQPVRKQDGEAAGDETLLALMAAYGRQHERNRTHRYYFVPEADALAAELDAASLSAAFETLWKAVNLRACLPMIATAFRYADGAALRRMTADWRARDQGCDYASNEAILLNDSREAILLALERGTARRYAALRGWDEPYLLDTVLTLGGDSDPLREDIVQALRRQLFLAFLSGEIHRGGSAWKAAYGTQRMLQQAAKNIVWEQGGHSFLLTDFGTVTAEGLPFSVADEAPVRVAHPMDLPAEETEAWRNYFHRLSVEQPFLQMEEAAHTAEEITRGRYAGIYMHFDDLTGRDDDGLHVRAYHNTVSIESKSVQLEYEQILPTGYVYTDILRTTYARMEEIRFGQYDRRVNHIVNLLDQAAAVMLTERDDLRTEQYLPSVPTSQLERLIRIAADRGSANVMAVLLQEKNSRFSTVDPMDDFAL